MLGPTHWEDGVILDPVISAGYKAHKKTKTTTVKTWIMSAMDFTKLFLKSRAKDFYLTALIAISNVPRLLAHVPGKHLLLHIYSTF
jgi:hypothetical protein